MTPAVSAARRVQGLGSSLDDLTLRDGRKLGIQIGGGVLPTPTLTRTIDGASNITVPVLDPHRRLLRDVLFSSKFDAELDGMWFRYIGASKSGETLTLKFIDRTVALLQEHHGPKSALREGDGLGHKGMTRAEFIKGLFDEAVPGFGFYCPQLHDKQPIKTKKAGKKAAEEAKDQRGKGVGDGAAGKVKGKKADAEQTEIVDRALRVAESLNAPLKARIALVAAMIDESECRNIHGGGGSSVGVLQLTDIHGSVDVRLEVEHCVHQFLTEGFTGDGGAIKLAGAHPDWSPAEIATTVQGNAAGGSVYAPYQEEARAWVEGFDGGEASGSLTITEPYEFKVEKDENYWQAAKRLAKQVNWRLFILPERAVLIDEEELIRGEVRLAITDDTDGVEDVDFDFNVNKVVNELTIPAWASQWSPPPGSVITVADYGPASLGPGDPPQKSNKKGKETGLSSAVTASTHEGKGRYLVSKIAVPLVDDPDRKATITARRPTPPLPEPEPQTKSVSVSGTGSQGSGAGNATIERMLQAAETEVAKGRPYAWGGGHASFVGPYDCSGFVSYLLHVGGFLDTPEATTGLAAWGQAGAGDLVTVYVKTSGGSSEEHTMIEIAGNFFMSGGGENPNANDGPCKFSPSTSYKAEFNVKRHPAGY